jgi:hypothetical protein
MLAIYFGLGVGFDALFLIGGWITFLMLLQNYFEHYQSIILTYILLFKQSKKVYHNNGNG